MKNTIISILLLATICFSLIGCGDKGTAEKQNTATKNDNSISSTNNDTDSKNDSATSNTAKTTDEELSCYLVRAQKEIGGLYGYVDVRTGEFKIEPQFKDADVSFCSDGWAVVEDQDENNSIINSSGEVLFEFGSIDYLREYEGDSIVVRKNDGSCHLYHGAEHIKELKPDEEDIADFGPSLPSKKVGSSTTEFYYPDKYIMMSGEKSDEENIYIWYDYDGNQIFKTDIRGCLAGDDKGYYHFSKEKTEIADLSGKVIETKPSGNRAVVFDGDNWYTMSQGTIYTNGYTEFKTGSIDNYNLMASDGVITFNGRYYHEDGEAFYNFNNFNYYYGFQNGYAKVSGGRKVSESGNFDGYIDVNGNSVFEIPEEDDFDSYTSALKDGYVIYGKDGLYGIKKITGEIILEPTYPSLYMRKNGEHVDGLCS